MTNANGDATKARILAVAVRTARDGLHLVTPRRIARLAFIEHSAIYYHFGDTAELLNAVASEAIRLNDARIIARLILDRHPSVATMTPDQRRAWLVASA